MRLMDGKVVLILMGLADFVVICRNLRLERFMRRFFSMIFLVVHI